MTVNETIRRKYEGELYAGHASDIASYLTDISSGSHTATLLELVLICMEFQWSQFVSSGVQPNSANEYLALYPELDSPELRDLLLDEEKRLVRARTESETLTEKHSASMAETLVDIPGFQIVREIARGGMGVVYQATQPDLKRDVALKMILHGNLASATDRARFRTEAEAVARLQHPNIVQIHTIGEREGKPYIAFEYVPGGNLALVINRTPQAIPNSAKLLEVLARAMHYAHESQIIHRDLKPANILLVPSNRPDAVALGADNTTQKYEPKITDFGLAKRMDESLGPTASEALLGTPSYMAPEQASGSGTPIGPTADIYALGSILYELLAGRPPFQAGSSMETLLLVLGEEPVPVTQLRPSVPRDLETICHKCLQKDPNKRYDTALSLAEDLRKFQVGEPILARPIGFREKSVRWVKRNRRLTITLVVSIALILIVAGVGLRNVLDERQKFREQRDRAQNNLYTALLAQADGHLDSRGPEWWWKGTNALESASKLSDHPVNKQRIREEYIRYLGSPYPSMRVARSWKYEGGEPKRVAMSPDAKLSAVSGRESIEVYDVFSGVMLHQQAFPAERIIALAFHHFRPVLYAIAGAKLYTIQLGPKLRISEWTTPDITEFSTLDIDPIGRYTILGSDRGRVYQLPLNESGIPVGSPSICDVGINRILSLAYRSDGDRFCASEGKHVVQYESKSLERLSNYYAQNPAYRIDFDQNQHITYVDPLSYGYCELNVQSNFFRPYYHIHENTLVRVWTLRGAHLTASSDGSLAIWGRQSGKPYGIWTTTRSEYGAIVDAAIDRERRKVVTLYFDGTVRLWEIFEPSERLILNSPYQTVCFVGDSHQIFNGRNLADVSDPQRPIAGYANHTKNVWGIAGDSQGHYLATGDEDGKVDIWNRHLNNPIKSFKHPGGLVWTLAFHPTKRWLAAGAERILIRDVETDAVVKDLEGHKFLTRSAAFHPSREILASCGSDRMVRIWDLESGKLKHEYGPLNATPWSLAFDPSGQWLCVGCENGQVLLWDVSKPNTGVPMLTPGYDLEGHQLPVRAVTFSRDGMLATGSEQGIVYLWDVSNNFRKIVKLQGGSGQIRSLQFSHDNQFLACGHYVADSVVWKLPQVRSKLRKLDLDW